jgi:hypothetical protein
VYSNRWTRSQWIPSGTFRGSRTPACELWGGDDIVWEVTDRGLEIEPPIQQPCENAFVYKIIRKDPL